MAASRQQQFAIIVGATTPLHRVYGGMINSGLLGNPRVTVARLPLAAERSWTGLSTAQVRSSADLSALMGADGPAAITIIAYGGDEDMAGSQCGNYFVACQGEVAEPKAEDLFGEIPDDVRTDLKTQAALLADWFKGRMMVASFMGRLDVAPPGLMELSSSRSDLQTLMRPRVIPARTSETFFHEELAGNFAASSLTAVFVRARERGTHLLLSGGRPFFVGNKGGVLVYATSDKLVASICDQATSLTCQGTSTLYIAPNS